MPDTAPNYGYSPIAPSDHCYAIVPSDSADLPATTKGIYVGTTGDVVVRTARSAADVTFRNVPAGYILDIRAIAVRQTGTTAADLVGMA